MDDKIRISLNILLTQDTWLLQNDANERSITHKLAEYIQQTMPEWNVDCEYNKNGTDHKKLGMSARDLLEAMKSLIGKAVHDKRLTRADAEWADSSIDSFERLIDMHGEEVPVKVAQSLYNQISEKLDSNELEEFGEILQITVTKANGLRGNLENVTVYPDIVVHHRGTDDNLIVIESKKSNELKNERWLWDYVKLIAMMHMGGRYAYKYGYFVNLPVKADLANHAQFTLTETITGFTVIRSA